LQGSDAAPAFIIATKADLMKSQQEMDECVHDCEEVAKMSGFNGALVVSAKDDVKHSVKKAIDLIAEALCSNDDAVKAEEEYETKRMVEDAAEADPLNRKLSGVGSGMA
jgi:hypothetical protein